MEWKFVHVMHWKFSFTVWVFNFHSNTFKYLHVYIDWLLKYSVFEMLNWSPNIIRLSKLDKPDFHICLLHVHRMLDLLRVEQLNSFVCNTFFNQTDKLVHKQVYFFQGTSIVCCVFFIFFKCLHITQDLTLHYLWYCMGTLTRHSWIHYTDCWKVK